MGDEVVCTSPTTGERLWALKVDGDLKALGGHLASAPVWSAGDLFVATAVGEVLQIRAADGTVKARYKIGSQLRYAPAIADGRLYVGTQDGKVVCRKIIE
jgi:outer membrane protein assembly factor BamB